MKINYMTAIYHKMVNMIPCVPDLTDPYVQSKPCDGDITILDINNLLGGIMVWP